MQFIRMGRKFFNEKIIMILINKKIEKLFFLKNDSRVFKKIKF